MKVARVSVRIPVELLEEVRRRAGRRGLSAYVTRGLQREIEASDALGEFIRDWEERHGPITEAELDQARRWLAD